MPIRSLLTLLLLPLAACVQQPAHELAGEEARLRSWVQVLSVNGEAPADPYRVMLAPGEYRLEVLYQTFSADYICHFKFRAEARVSYEIVDHSNPEPLVLYRWVAANALWAERRDPVEPVCESTAWPGGVGSTATGEHGMKLIGVQLSPYVRKVAVALTVKGVEYEQEVVVPGMAPPEFIEISPLNKIPVLVDGDFVTPDSSVICEYLEEKYPSPPLLPRGIEARARARFLEEYGDTRLLEYASIPFIENFVNPRIRNTEPDAARVKEVTEQKLPTALDYLESRVPEDGFLFGDFCIADLAIVSPIINASYGGYQPDSGRWPKYAAFVQRVKAYDPVARVLAVEQQVLEAMMSG